MKSVILFTVSAMACLLPILSVEGQLQAAWKVGNEGKTEKLGFISTNGLASSLPFSLLQQLFTGNNSSGNLFRLFSGGKVYDGNTATPSSDSIIDSVTLASHTDKYTRTMAPLTTIETTTKIIPETTTDTIPDTTTETILEATTDTYIESTPTTTPTTTLKTTPTTTLKTTPTTTLKTTPTTTTEKVDDRPVPDGVVVGPDSLLYFKSNQSLSQTGCRTYCHGFRSFRLATAKTNESMEALRSHGNVMVDMSISRNPRTSEVRYIWGDGTELDTSLTHPDLKEPVMNSGRTSSVMVMFTSGTNVLLDDAPSSYLLPCLCQGTHEGNLQSEPTSQ